MLGRLLAGPLGRNPWGAALLLWLVLHFAGKAGYERGFSQARSQCQQATLSEYARLLHEATQSIAAAHEQSQTINRALAERQRASAKAAKDLRDALSATKTERANCVFDADSLRHIEAAVVTGIRGDTGSADGAVSAAGSDDGQ